MPRPPEPRFRITGPVETIGSIKQKGVTEIWIGCADRSCCHSAMMPIERLNLRDTALFINIGREAKLVCEKCGGREFFVRDLERR